MNPESQPLIDLKLVRDMGAAMLPARVIDGCRPVLVVPEDYKMIIPPPEHEAPLPDHIRQQATLDEVASFIAYVKQFKRHNTQIFATTNDKGANFIAVIDYHEAGKDGVAGRNKHKASFSPAYAPEFSAWLAVNRAPQTQEQFLDHLRRWGGLVVSHSDADLLELASSLDFKSEGQYSSAIERVKGGRRLVWNETVQGSGNVKGTPQIVPERIVLRLPLFTGGREYDIAVDLLYRVSNGTLKIITEFQRENLVIRQAVLDLVEDVKSGTGIEPFIGSLK